MQIMSHTSRWSWKVERGQNSLLPQCHQGTKVQKNWQLSLISMKGWNVDTSSYGAAHDMKQTEKHQFQKRYKKLGVLRRLWGSITPSGMTKSDIFVAFRQWPLSRNPTSKSSANFARILTRKGPPQPRTRFNYCLKRHNLASQKLDTRAHGRNVPTL